MESVIDRQRPARRGDHKNSRPLSVKGVSGQNARYGSLQYAHTPPVERQQPRVSRPYAERHTPAHQKVPGERTGLLFRAREHSQRKNRRSVRQVQGQKSLTILGRLEQTHSGGNSTNRSWSIAAIADGFLAPIRMFPAVMGQIGLSNRLSRILATDLSPSDQGFVAGALLFLCVSLVPVGNPDIVRALSYSPFPDSIRIDSEAVPDALATGAATEENVGVARHVSEETVELDVSRFQRLEFDSHTVRPGETLSGIASEYGITLDTLVSFNQISDSRRVQVGTEFDIPSRNGLRHIVRSGDSVSGIASDYSVEVDEILDANDMDSVSLNPGQELFIPGARMRRTELRLILGELFIRPTPGRFTSGFGNRIDPFTGRRSFHNGVDWANAPGTWIVASMAGRVADVGSNLVYGDYVVIEHPENFQSMYAHLSQISVSRGQSVSQRQRIGRMGNTGRSTGTHLHFSLFENGRPVDPLRHVH